MDENTTVNKSGNKMMPVIIGVVVLLLLGAGAFFLLSNRTGNDSLTGDNDVNTTFNSSVNEANNENVNSTSDISLTEDEIKTFNVSGSNFKFDVTEMKVKKGETVRIVFTNSQGMHDWVIDEFDARTKILEEGMSETIEFVADQAGTFEYYCSVGNHKAMGMVGNLIVEE